MRFIYFYTGAVNGEDASGHYIRAGISVGNCATRTPDLEAGSSCPARFYQSDSEASAAAARAKTSSTLLGYLLGGK
jgi:hypothetical protein